MSRTIINKDGRTVTIDTDDSGNQTVTATPSDPSAMAAHTGQPGAVVIHRHHGMEPGAAFVLGMMMGALILWLLLREGRRRRHRPDPRIAAGVVDVSREEVAALARRTATLEQIVTDPATRTAREIDALR